MTEESSSSSPCERISLMIRDNTVLKRPKENRSCTDYSFLVILLLVMFSLFVFVIYCFMNGDVERVYNGYDECGYICGIKNEHINPLERCNTDEANKIDEPYLQMEAPSYLALDLENVTRKCVNKCDNTHKEVFLHRCIPKNLTNDHTNTRTHKKKHDINLIISEVFEDLWQTKYEITILCILSCILSHFILCTLRFVVGIVVWLILFVVVLASLTVSIFLWSLIIVKTNEDHFDTNIYLTFAIFSTIFTITIMLIIVAMRKRVALVVQLFKEAGRVVQNMPTLLVQPVWTFSLLSIIVVVWFNNALYIESSGVLSSEPSNNNTRLATYYKKNVIMKFTRIYNIFIFFWIIQFIIACQHIVIADVVTTWYFTKNKNSIIYPVLTSNCKLLKYHLGSAAYGSLIINAVTIVRHICYYLSKICKKIENRVRLLFCNTFQCTCCRLFEFLPYLTRNAYIEISIYSDNFSKSGKRASDIIALNMLRVSAIDFVGDFVLIMIKVIVVLLNTIIGYHLLKTNDVVIKLWVPLIAVGFFSYFVAHCFISVYEVLIDSLFICFCEDCCLNDLTKEYFMSNELMDFAKRNQKKTNMKTRPDSFIII